jgi:hypothetical protein
MISGDLRSFDYCFSPLRSVINLSTYNLLYSSELFTRSYLKRYLCTRSITVSFAFYGESLFCQSQQKSNQKNAIPISLPREKRSGCLNFPLLPTSPS